MSTTDKLTFNEAIKVRIWIQRIVVWKINIIIKYGFWNKTHDWQIQVIWN